MTIDGLKHSGYRAVHNWDKLLPVVALFLMVVIFFGQRAIVDKQHDAAILTCERSNQARVASVTEKRADIRFTLRPALRLWRSAIPAGGLDESTPPRIREAFYNLLSKLERGIHSKQHAIHEAIEAQAEVAIRPGSPIVDCNKAT